MYISVIVPYYNQPDYLEHFLLNINLLNYPTENYEVILVNNGQSEIIFNPKLIKYDLKIINEKYPGSYSARNAGIRVSKGRLLAFTDIDCLPRSDWLENASQCFQSDKKIQRLMGEIILYPVRSYFSLGWIVDSSTAFAQRINFLKGVSPTANLFVKKEVFDLVGFFDYNLFSGGDFEWSNRAKSHEVPLAYSDKVVVLHPSRSLFNIYKKQKRVLASLVIRFSRERKLLKLLILRSLPPLIFGVRLLRIGRPPFKMVIAITILWIINLICLPEILIFYFIGIPKKKFRD